MSYGMKNDSFVQRPTVCCEFISSALLMFNTKTRDYHYKTDFKTFKRSADGRLIFTGITAYLSVQDMPPYVGFKKMDIQNWMMAVAVMVDRFVIKSELLREVKSHSPLPANKFDEHSENYGHQIIQLLTYYCN
jgi:hypothetical protein